MALRSLRSLPPEHPRRRGAAHFAPSGDFGTFPCSVLCDGKLHIVDEPILFLADAKYFWGVAIVTGLLKDLGWGAILYLAAIAGIDPTLYEAATIDGASRWQRIMNVTVPGIMPTMMIMIIFAVAGMLNNNFTQIYVFQNVLNMEASQVIDTYVYNIGLKQFHFGIGTAASLMKSVMAILLLFGANFVSGKLTDSSLF